MVTYTPETYFNTAYDFSTRDLDGRSIADALCALDRPGYWLDLGCGPTLVVWSTFLPSIERIVGADVQEENLALVRRQIESKETFAPLLNARRYLASQTLAHNRKASDKEVGPDQRNWDLTLHDINHLRPEWNDGFDVVSQIGCFGCLSSLDELRAAAVKVNGYLKTTGRFLSVTWPQRIYDGVATCNGPVSHQLNADLIADIYDQAGLSILHVETGQTRDPAFDGIIVITAGKGKER